MRNIRHEYGFYGPKTLARHVCDASGARLYRTKNPTGTLMGHIYVFYRYFPQVLGTENDTMYFINPIFRERRQLLEFCKWLTSFYVNQAAPGKRF